MEARFKCFNSVSAKLYHASMTQNLRILCPALPSWPCCFGPPSFAGRPFMWPRTTWKAIWTVSTATGARKSAESKAKIQESIRALKPDVLALQEVGGTNALLELRDFLRPKASNCPTGNMCRV